MKKLVFVLSIAISTMLFACASDSNDDPKMRNQINQSGQMKMAGAAETVKLDSINAILEKTATVIDQNIKALNEVEDELMKEFDLK